MRTNTVDIVPEKRERQYFVHNFNKYGYTLCLGKKGAADLCDDNFCEISNQFRKISLLERVWNLRQRIIPANSAADFSGFLKFGT